MIETQLIDKSFNKYWIYQKIREVKDVFFLFFITRLAIFSVTYFGVVMFKFISFPDAPKAFPYNFWLNPWTGWDGIYYINIAKDGYLHGNTAWFPAYPFLIRVFDLLFRNTFLSGIIVSNIAFLIGLIFLYKLVKQKFDEGTAWRTILYLSIFPTSFFFSAVLSEATFLMFSLMTFYFAEREQWKLSGLFGLFTVLTRSLGIIIVLSVFLIYLYKKKFNYKEIKIDVLPILLMPSGIFIFMGILWLFKQSPLSFMTAQQVWGRTQAVPWWDLIRSFQELSSYGYEMFLAGNYPVRLLSHFILTILFLVLSFYVFKLINWSYGLYSLLMLIVPLSNPSVNYPLYSDLRFIVVIFPVFILLGIWGKDRIVNTLIIVFSLLFLSLFSIWNGLGGWIS